MLQRFFRHYLLAVQFFTRIPVTGPLADWVGYSPAMLRASAAHFPGIGWLVGLLAAGVYALLLALLPPTLFAPLVAAALSTVVTVMLTGGFHEDGLADVADGLGGSYDRERALEIMKDSRVGAFGAMALTLALLCKVTLLALLGSADSSMAENTATPVNGWLAAGALLAAHVVSRGLPLLLVYLLPHVGDAAGSKSKPLADQITPASLGVAFLWCLFALLLSSFVWGVASLMLACGLSALTLLGMGLFFKHRLQGFTGDCLGATQQVCEIAFYLGLAASL